MRIQIRIQVKRITKLISNYLLKVKKKIYFQICTEILEISYFFRFRLEIYDFLRKKKKLVELSFSLHFIPLDPDPNPHITMIYT